MQDTKYQIGNKAWYICGEGWSKDQFYLEVDILGVDKLQVEQLIEGRIVKRVEIHYLIYNDYFGYNKRVTQMALFETKRKAMNWWNKIYKGKDKV